MSPFNFDSQSVGLVERIWNKVGAPSIVLAVLFMFYSGHLSSPLTRVEAAIAAHRAETALQLEEARKQTRLLFEDCMSRLAPERCVAALFDPDRVDAQTTAQAQSSPRP